MPNPVNILIVEDELLIAKNTAKKLNKFGYNVPKIVATGQGAIDFVAKDQPDLILMDIAIKGEIDGIETASRIKGIADIPVIFLTAYANDETLERASKTGCYGYLIKPFKDRELQATIKMTLSKHSEQSEIKEALQTSISGQSSEYDDIYKDNLTNLPNKLFLRDLFNYLSSLIIEPNTTIPNKASSPLQPAVQQDKSQTSQLNLIGVYNISLERFSKISSFLNREEQDSLVKEIAHRLTTWVDSFDAHGSTVYLKSDNFAVLLAIEERIKASEYGELMLTALKKPFIIDDREIHLSPCIGISFCPGDSVEIEELLQQGYQAIEYAKTQGGNRCQIFTFAFNIKRSKATDDLRLESELHHALERQELELYYQPKVNLQTNLIFGAEALIRWNHPKMGRIDAKKFIPLAEDSGLIRPIGEWVLTTACQQMQTWHNAGFDSLKISVNLSGAQFKQSDLFHIITQALFKTSLEAQYLELEVTETILVENIKANVQKLNLLKKLGIQISLDDFGTGYSSLGYLQQFPFDTLKIDACFVQRINENQVNAVITKTIIDMAHQLGLKVIAEGVETLAELLFLQEAKCDGIQGFLFSRPISAKEFTKLIRNRTTLLEKITVNS